MSDTEKEKKRKQIDELEIDLDADIPKSKKQKRLEKKGKADSKSKRPVRDNQDDLFEDDKHESTEGKQPETKSDYGVWIGNLSFDTTKDDLKRFIIIKTSQEDDEAHQIKESSITRINLPRGKGNKIKGFAYVDFTTPELVKSCINVSEQVLNGRKLLIKDAKSYEGRPAAGANKNPPSRILFVGNLSFDTTESQLEMHFQHCGEITKIRMATFEDSGSCKGFSFVDFREVEAATKALGDKRCKKLNGRMLRMEYGEDRSKRSKQQKASSMQKNYEHENPVVEESSYSAQESQEPKKKQRKAKGAEYERMDQHRNPGLALATAQRAKVSIVESAGKKVTFSD